MWKYILKRILFFLPTIILITLISFIISQNAPGDPVELMLTSKTSEGGQSAELLATEKEYLLKREELGLNLPIFYLALTSYAEPDTLYKIPKPKHKEALKRLVYTFGNWEKLQEYYRAAKKLYLKVVTLNPTNDTISKQRTLILASVNGLLESGKQQKIEHRIKKIGKLLAEVPEIKNALTTEYQNLKNAWENVVKNKETWKIYIPKITFYGTHNQYHRWLMGMLRFDFGISYVDKRPIGKKMLEAIKWSLIINLISIVLSYLIAIPIGVYSAVHKYSLSDKVITTILFILYSLPSFWVATMLIFFLGGGDFWDVFPASGVQDIMSANWPLWKRILDWAYHLVLPVFTYTYASFAFLSRQMRVGMLEVLNQDFIRTARAKGLSEKVVIWKHAFRNSLIPIITLFASIFPAMVGGSVILETIFSIPGMGFLSYNAILARDYPVIIAVFTIAGILTLVGILVADILYAVVDPRISYSKK